MPSQPVDVIKHSSRWAGQRWLLDAVIGLVGPEWDQGRVAYYAAACGQDSQVDFTAVRPRIRKYDDLARGFSKAARRREVLARDAVHLQGNVSRDGRRSPDRTRLMAERDARQQGISFDEAIAAIADSIPAKRLGRPEEFGAACAFLYSAQAAAGVPPLAQVAGVLVEDAVPLPGSVVDQPGTPPRARKIRGPGGGRPRCERIDGLLNPQQFGRSRQIRTSNGKDAIVEIPGTPGLSDGVVRRGRNGLARLRVLLGLSAAAAAASVLVACSSAGTSAAPSSGAAAGSSSPAAAAASTVTAVKIGGATVLANSKGFTLYSFGPDTPAKSNCNGTCAQNWPPEMGPVTAAGIKGTFGTIKRSDGSTQATFDGHPLYTFVGDNAPGQANGNGLNAAGGVWHEITLSGAAAPASGGGGNGY